MKAAYSQEFRVDPVKDKKILLIVSGGIAAYKCLDLVRRLRERGADVTAVLTESGKQFVTPLSLAALCENPVYTDLFDLKDETEMGHIALSRNSDLIVVAPATADLMARMAQGMANDLATTILLATDTPVLVAPAMNVRMWQHPATRRNIATLKWDGIHFIGPNEGDMACGEYGPGRMSEVPELLDAIEDLLAMTADQPLLGKSVMVTAGPTYEPIDPVRYIGNRSSGKQGYALAATAARLGAETTLISGPTALPPPPNVNSIHVETAKEMLDAAKKMGAVDIAICAAAVADWRVAEHSDQKIKKKSTAKSPPLIELVENPDILKTISKKGPRRPTLVIGFAAETEHVSPNAQKKRQSKNCDWIVANDVSEETGIMGGDRNTIHLITPSGVEDWPEMLKDEVAEKLLRRTADYFNEQRSAAQ